jgi:hypothetical protein
LDSHWWRIAPVRSRLKNLHSETKHVGRIQRGVWGRPVRHGVSKGVEDGRIGRFGGRPPAGLEGSGRAGPVETLGSPWIPFAIRAWSGVSGVSADTPILKTESGMKRERREEERKKRKEDKKKCKREINKMKKGKKERKN